MERPEPWNQIGPRSPPNLGDHFIEAGTTAEWTNVGVTPSMVITYGPGGGQVTVGVGGGALTLTDAQAPNEVLKFTGNGGASVNVTFPDPASDAGTYRRVIRNLSAGAIVAKTSAGTTVTVAVPAITEMTAEVGFDSGGAFRITTDAST